MRVKTPPSAGNASGGGGSSDPTDTSGEPWKNQFRGYKVGIFTYYLGVLAACGVLAVLVMDLRQRDGWQMRPIGTVEQSVVSSSGETPEEREVGIVDFRVESISSKPLDERRFAFDPFILLIVLAGAVGGTLHGMTSLAEHSGRRTLKHGWGPYYVGLPVTGAGMALAIYYILRGGIAGFSVSNATAPEATYLAWAVLAGLFSSNALDKLGDVFDALFQSRKKKEKEEQEAQRDRDEPLPGRTAERL